MMGYGWGMGFAGWIFMVVFWVALVALVVWAVTRLLPSSGQSGQQLRAESPEEILDRRFAGGEIDAEEYRRARHALGSGRR